MSKQIRFSTCPQAVLLGSSHFALKECRQPSRSSQVCSPRRLDHAICDLPWGEKHAQRPLQKDFFVVLMFSSGCWDLEMLSPSLALHGLLSTAWSDPQPQLQYHQVWLTNQTFLMNMQRWTVCAPRGWGNGSEGWSVCLLCMQHPQLDPWPLWFPHILL